MIAWKNAPEIRCRSFDAEPILARSTGTNPSTSSMRRPARLIPSPGTHR
jgi:hypothetical protein